MGELPEIPCFVSLDSLANFSFSGVVGGDSQVPVTKFTVQCGEIGNGRHGRLFRVASFIDPAVDTQAVIAPCGFHELPEPDGPGPGIG